ncbi:MAG: sarcosine oxidase subunit gamma family protein [Pseudomonadota bacterium]
MPEAPVTVSPAPVVGMITLKANLAAPAIASAIKLATGIAIPGPRRILSDGAVSLMWMAPDELLVLCPVAEVPARLSRLSDTLGSAPHLAADVSDARVIFDVTGQGWREVLAKLTPADMHPDVFVAGELRRSRLAQIPAGFWMEGAGSVRVMVFRSVAQYAEDLLRNAVDQTGRIEFFNTP